ncbi:TolC family protein [uncultured Bacteroides sp.]|uniref:TolC family protein n=1 Tax=uncultured Bacteroides sp. TaxID=162156 RepID=UPI0026321C73|nr:TolC family protein [uncultured Bacteroides sp.]
MKRITTIYIIILLLHAGAHAQTSGTVGGGAIGIDEVLRRIEANNQELQANAHSLAAQKLENRAENNLPDPTLSYAHLWGARDKGETIGELVVSQSFDFPTLYATRARANRLRTASLDAQATDFRQQLLLRAKELCLDILMLQRLQTLLDERLEQASELQAYYRKRLETGDANILETNKLNLELLNIRTQSRTNRTALEAAWLELSSLNGGQPLTASSIADSPSCPLPADYEVLREEVLAADAALQSLEQESAAARKQVSVSRQGWLPKLELGYRRNTESGAPFNGVVVGFSLPIFENRSKVKTAKAQAMDTDFRREGARLRAESELAQLYGEARALQASIEEYQEALRAQRDMDLLRQALTGGQISVTEYFVEVSVVYQSRQNLLEIENRYRKVMARIYKGRL